MSRAWMSCAIALAGLALAGPARPDGVAPAPHTAGPPPVEAGASGAALGISIGTGSPAAGKVDGVTIVEIVPGGPAERAGLAAGDLITALDGQSLAAGSRDAASQKLLRFMATVDPGESLAVDYVREATPATTQLVAAALPPAGPATPGTMAAGAVPPGAGLVAVSAPGCPMPPGFVAFGPGPFGPPPPDGIEGSFAGLRLAPVSESLGRYFNAKSGLLVIERPASREIPLEDGDVILAIAGRKPTSPAHAARILGSYVPGEEVALQILRDRKPRDVSFPVPEPPLPPGFAPGPGTPGGP